MSHTVSVDAVFDVRSTWLRRVDVVPSDSLRREAIGTAFTRLHNH